MTSAGGFYWPEDASKGVFLVMSIARGQPEGCPVNYQFEIKGENYNNQPVHLLMTFTADEHFPDLVGLGRPVPAGLIQFRLLPSDTGDRGILANDVKPYSARHRVRAYNGKGLISPWSGWKKSSQKDCLSLGFRCREGD